MNLRKIIRGVGTSAEREMAQKPNPQGGTASREKSDEKKMEGVEVQSPSQFAYALKPSQLLNEDILFCIDVDAESMVEMKAAAPNGRAITRMDSIKQAIVLFIHAKLAINPDHRFAFATLGKTASWVFVPYTVFINFFSNICGFSFVWEYGLFDFDLFFELFALGWMLFGN